MTHTNSRRKKIPDVTGAEAKLVVSKTVFGQDSEEAEHIEVRPFQTVPARVGVSLGRTINLGNYESARVSVTMEVPCYREEIIRIYPKLFEHVADRISEEVEKIAGRIKPELSIEEII